MEIAYSILGSSVIVAIITFLSDRVKRRDILHDANNDTTRQIRHVNDRIDGVEKKVDAIKTNTERVAACVLTISYDKIKTLGLSYIRKGKITPEESESLIRMYREYLKIEKNDFLEKIMAEVYKLRTALSE